jgi:anti-sigma-K factor RskA
MTERQEEQAALHALHLLDAHEERILRSEARSDARLETLIPALEDTVSQIALAVPAELPPPEYRRALLAELKEHRRAQSTSFAKPLALLRSSALAWVVAAVVAVIASYFHHRDKRHRQEAAALKEDTASARNESAGLREKLQAEEKKLVDARLEAEEQAAKVEQLTKVNALARMEAAPLRAVTRRFDETVAVVVWDREKQMGKLRVEKLPPAGGNKDYQLWVIDKKSGASVSAGVVKTDARGGGTMTFQPLEPVAQGVKFAISIEAPGGVARKSADGPIVLASP